MPPRTSLSSAMEASRAKFWVTRPPWLATSAKTLCRKLGGGAVAGLTTGLTAASLLVPAMLTLTGTSDSTGHNTDLGRRVGAAVVGGE